jgi:hypothetical protein
VFVNELGTAICRPGLSYTSVWTAKESPTGNKYNLIGDHRIVRRWKLAIAVVGTHAAHDFDTFAAG